MMDKSNHGVFFDSVPKLPNKKISMVSGMSLLNCKPIFLCNTKFLVTASSNHIKVFNVSNGELLKVLHAHKYKIVSLCNAGEDESFISCDEKGKVIQWLNKENAWEILHKHEPLSDISNKWESVSAMHLCQSAFLFNLCTNETKGRYCVFGVSRDDPTYINILTSGMQPNINQLSVGFISGMAAFIINTKIYVHESIYMKNKRTLNSAHVLTCVSCHDTEAIVAAGCVIGAVYLWHNATSLHATRTQVHWHHLPVADVAFSCTGHNVYSVGGEGVLLSWHTKEQRRLLCPHLGPPIKYVTVSRDNTHSVTAHVDNGLSVIDNRQLCKLGSIQSLNTNPAGASVGLVHNVKSDCIILNGRTGHLLFYNPIQDKALYQLDVTMSNLCCAERTKDIPNPEVLCATTSPLNGWMATAEQCHIANSLTDNSIKLWNFNSTSQEWNLSTVIESPHDSVIGLNFQPINQSEEAPILASCGLERKFKLWKLFYNQQRKDSKPCWRCVESREFRGLQCSGCVFSPDGTLLAVIFEHIVTIWTVQDFALFCVLSQASIDHPIRQVLFQGHYLVCRADHWLYSWNLLTCALDWKTHFTASFMTIDLHSDVVAVFAHNTVYLFDPLESHPVHSITMTGENESFGVVVGAIFASLDGASGALNGNNKRHREAWHSHAQLYFINDKHELYCVTPSDGSQVITHEIEPELANRTTFAKSLPSTKLSLKSLPNKTSNSPSFTSFAAIKEILLNIRVQHLDSFQSLSQKLCEEVNPKPLQHLDAPEVEQNQVKSLVNTQDVPPKKSIKHNINQILKTDFNELVEKLNL